MAAPCFIAWNSAEPSTSTLTVQPSIITASAVSSVLQIKAGTPKLRVIEWGYAFATVPTAVVAAELISSSTGITMNTALGTSDIMPYNDVTGPGTQVITGSTSGSAFATGATTEVAATVRVLASQQEWGSQFKQQFPLGREPEINGGTFLRIRFKCAAALSVSAYIIWEE
jgi:hypothetical protein